MVAAKRKPTHTPTRSGSRRVPGGSLSEKNIRRRDLCSLDSSAQGDLPEKGREVEEEVRQPKGNPAR